MRLVRFQTNNTVRIGALTGDSIIDIREARAHIFLEKGVKIEEALRKARVEIPSDMIEFIEGGEETLSKAKESIERIDIEKVTGALVHRLENVKILAPIPNPPMILNMGNAYRPYPITGFTIKPITALVNPEDPIIIPREITDFGPVFECELAIVIGKKGRRIPENEGAYDYVYGYTVYNDVTDYGKQIEGRFDSKIHDTFCPMGPCITTREGIDDPHELAIKVWINKQLACNSSTREMQQRVPTFVSVPSRTLTLLPGTVISTGTPAPGRIKPGDVVEMEIEKIGKLRNPVTLENS